MALIGTHIRFALDIKDDFGGKSLDKYISGAVYPDSRYLTKIDRKITHWTDTYDSKFCQNDDFKKGWMSHLIYDRIQGDVFKEIFPELFVNFKEETKILSPENWVLRTSLKILQDLDDIEKFNVKNYLKCLEYFETPNKEKNEVMKEYNQMFVDIYQKDKVEILDLVNMWIKFEIKKELTDWIEKKTNQFSLDGEILKKIPLIYPATIKQYRQEIDEKLQDPTF